MRTLTPSPLIDYQDLTVVPGIWPRVAEKYGEIWALHNPHSSPEIKLTYGQLWEQIQAFGSALQRLGVRPDDKVSLFSDNCPQWLIADQGIMVAGAVNAVRSSQAEKQELLYIFRHSDSTTLIAENLATVRKLEPEIYDGALGLILLLSDETPPADCPVKVVNFSQAIAFGQEAPQGIVPRQSGDLATLIYTSGTTGQPKGVMLTHGNLVHQIRSLVEILPLQPGQIALSILPTWHAYERTGEYYLLSQGITQVYTNLRSVKKDLATFKPHYMIAVPRLWESIYEGIQKNFRNQSPLQQKLIGFFLGVSQAYFRAQHIANNQSLEHFQASPIARGWARCQGLALKVIHQVGDRLIYHKVRGATGDRIQAVVSGGGSLPKHIDNFFEVVGINILVGYGLTETAPVVTVRRLHQNIRTTSGTPLAESEVRIVHPDTKETLPKGDRGLVLLRGPQIMRGYYKNPAATAQAIDEEGWFDSGDLGWLTPLNDLVLTGRAKDTIVLRNGENIEPQPLEDACLRSAYIDQIMLLGQDEKELGALIVPNIDTLETWIQQQQLPLTLPGPGATLETLAASGLYSPDVQKLFRQELSREVKDRPGYRPDDRIGPFALILEPFTMENGLLTQTLKMKRPQVREKYQDLIRSLYGHGD